MAQLDNIIIDFIMTELIPERDHNTIGISDNLIDSGIIDSLGIQKLIAFLEKEFIILILDMEVVPENFQSVEAIESFIKTKKRNKELK
jgi:acyl carrier protein